MCYGEDFARFHRKTSQNQCPVLSRRGSEGCSSLEFPALSLQRHDLPAGLGTRSWSEIDGAPVRQLLPRPSHQGPLAFQLARPQPA